jgi:hypothetical protein
MVSPSARSCDSSSLVTAPRDDLTGTRCTCGLRRGGGFLFRPGLELCRQLATIREEQLRHFDCRPLRRDRSLANSSTSRSSPQLQQRLNCSCAVESLGPVQAFGCGDKPGEEVLIDRLFLSCPRFTLSMLRASSHHNYSGVTEHPTRGEIRSVNGPSILGSSVLCKPSWSVTAPSSGAAWSPRGRDARAGPLTAPWETVERFSCRTTRAFGVAVWRRLDSGVFRTNPGLPGGCVTGPADKSTHRLSVDSRTSGSLEFHEGHFLFQGTGVPADHCPAGPPCGSPQ